MTPLTGRSNLRGIEALKPRATPSMGGNSTAITLIGCCTLLLLSGCMSPNITIPAPVLDRSLGTSSNKDSRVNASARTPAAPPVAAVESSARPGYYTVKPGDTIFHISLDNGQNWKDLAKWNNLDNPNLIEVGKVLRVVPPEAVVNTEGVVVRPVNSQNNPTTSTGVMTSVGTSSGMQSSTQSSAAPAPAPATAPSTAPVTPQATSQTTTSTATPAPSAVSSGEMQGDTPSFIWPSVGKVTATFDESKNKGVDISGKLGDPVLAAADGKVVYSGSGLRGYGNLVIIKHNNTFLSAYAHTQSILVKEDQNVRQGQKIAEVGSSDAEQAGLHFEIRKYGKPVDPLKWLPTR